MKTTEFRCEECDKLLAKFTGEWNFADSKPEERTYICKEMEQYLEIKCPRCKHTSMRMLIDDECVIGKEIHGDVTVHMPKLQIGQNLVDAEALEAHNQVSRHGDNV